MRMRKKKNLSERLLNVSDLLFEINIEERNFALAGETKEYINMPEWFGSEKPLYLEIGCGK